MRHPPSLVLGVPIDDLTMPDTIEEIGALVAHGRASGRTHQIATVNVDFLVNAAVDPWLQRTLQDASLNLADGAPLLATARLAGIPLRQRVAGADLVPALAAAAPGRQWRIHFFGSAPGVVERALDILRTEHPDAQLSGTSGPYLADVTEIADTELDAIVAADPDICCFALGNPKQERFIAAHRDRLGIPVMIGIGGSLDLLVGDKRRAPEWMQRAGLEWVMRAIQEPRRLGVRYARDAVVFGPQALRWTRMLRASRAGPDLAVVVDGEGTLSVSCSHTTRSGVPFEVAAERFEHADRLRVDLCGATPRPSALAELVGFVRLARRYCVPVEVTGLAPPTLDELGRLGLARIVGHQSEEVG